MDNDKFIHALCTYPCTYFLRVVFLISLDYWYGEGKKKWLIELRWINLHKILVMDASYAMQGTIHAWFSDYDVATRVHNIKYIYSNK